MSTSRWRDARDLFERRRPGAAFDHLFAGAVESLSGPDVRAISLHGAGFVQAMHPACFGAERLDRLSSFRSLFGAAVAPRAFAAHRGRIAFPVVTPDDAHGDAFVDVSVSLGAAGSDEVPGQERLDAAAAAAVRDALAAVRARYRTERTFVVTLPDLPIEGASLGLAVVLAAVSGLTGWLLDERWAVTGRVGAGGQIDPVGHMDRKRALRASERPASRMLGPAEGLLAADGWDGVASLDEAVARVFAPDLVAARRQYLDRAALASQFAERRRFGEAGMAPHQLTTRKLAEVYVEPALVNDASRRLARRLDGDDLDEATAQELRGRPLAEVIARHRLLVICADAGMGKSTLLQHVAQQAIAQARDTADAPIPVQVSVKDFPGDGGTSLGLYALEQLRTRWPDLPEATTASWSVAVVDHLDGGRVLLLVDGLDEVPAAPRRAVVDAIDAYFENHPTAQLVLTTRRQAYEAFPLRGQVDVWHLAPLDRQKRREFLGRNMSGQRELEAVWRLFEESPGLAELGGNPFFLTLALLIAQADLAGLRHRAQLYEKAFARLRWNVDEDGIEWRRAIFAHVADAQRADGMIVDPVPRLDRRIDRAWRALAPAEAPVAAAQLRREAVERAGLFAPEVGGALSFFHHSFQEYLASVCRTREPIEELPARLAALRSDPDSGEVVLLALGRLAHVCREPEQTARVLLKLSERDDATETIAGDGLLTAWQAIREGVTDDEDEIVGRILARLAARVREIPHPRAVETFVLALLSFERIASARSAVLDELIRLVDAEHPVPWIARHYALQVIARAARQVPRAAATCRRAWERFERQDLPEGVVAVMLVEGVALDEAMLAPLRRALEHGWLEPLAEALARDAKRRGEQLRRLAGPASEQDAAVVATLALLAVRDDEAVEAALGRHVATYDVMAGKAMAYLANREDRVVARVLERASEAEDRARLLAMTVGRGLAPSMVARHVVPWLLAAPLDCACAWLRAICAGPGHGAAGTALHEALRGALAGPLATAARAAALLTSGMSPVAAETAARLAAVVPALVARVDGVAALELLGALVAARLAEPTRALLARLVRTRDPATLSSLLPSVNFHDPAQCEIVVGRMTDGVAAQDYHGVVACAGFLMHARVASAESVAGLRSVDEDAPLHLRVEAALLLVHHGVHDVGVARTLARAVAARGAPPTDHRLSIALGKVVEEGQLRDEEAFRLLVPGFMDGSDREGGHALVGLLRHDDALFEILLDALLAATDPARQTSARQAVVALIWQWRHATPPDERLLRRFEARFPASPVLLHDLEHIARGRPSWYEALERALSDVDRDPKEALDAAWQLRHVLAACEGDGALDADQRGRLRSRIVAVLRGLLAHEAAAVALRAATELVFLGERDVRPALHRALADEPMVALRAALALYGLAAEDEHVVAALLACLASDVAMCQAELQFFCIPELAIARERFAASGQGPDGEAIGEPREDVVEKILRAPKVAEAAAWLLVALRRDEVVPALLDWLEGADVDRCHQAFAMLTELGADREPRVLVWQLRRLRDAGWLRGEGSSRWLWLRAPEALAHVDVLVELLAKPPREREALRAWLTDCCSARSDWAGRVAVLAESRADTVAVELTLVLAGAGHVTQALAARTVAWCCEAEPLLLRPLLAELGAAIDAHDVLAAAWRRRLADRTPAARVAAAGLFQRWGVPAPGALRAAMADAYRVGLDDEDLHVRWEALSGLENLGLVDDGVALAARRVLDETLGDAPMRVMGGVTAQGAAWAASDVSVRRVVAQRLLSWGRHSETATRWLVGALQIPWPSWELEEIVDALRAQGSHDDVLRSSLEAWLRDHPVGSLGEDAIMERAQQVGVAADVLDRRALEALGASDVSAHAMRVLFGREFLSDDSGGLFMRGYSRDPSERALYWAERIANEASDAVRVLRVLAAAAGAAPVTTNMLVEAGANRPAGDVLADVAEIVRRRDGDGFLEELARAFLRRWASQWRSTGTYSPAATARS